MSQRPEFIEDLTSFNMGSIYLKEHHGGAWVPLNALAGPEMLGLRIRNFIWKTRKSDLERQACGERELLIYLCGWIQAVNLKNNSCRGLGLQNKNGLEAAQIFCEYVVCQLVSVFGFFRKCVCISRPPFLLTCISPFSFSLSFSFSPTLLWKHLGDKIMKMI